MRNRLYFQPLYFSFWLLYFVVARGVFLVYHLESTSQLTSSDTLLVFWHGLRLDASATAYLCLLPFLALLVETFFKSWHASGFLRGYTYTVLVLLSVLLAADLELFRSWGYRLDATPLQYLNTPAEVAASVSSAPLFLLLLIALLHTMAFILLYLKGFDLKRFNLLSKQSLKRGVVSTLYLAFLILPLRGGWQQIPINQSVAYFSDKPFANQAGLNLPWNLGYALSKYNKASTNPYQYMPATEAISRVQALYKFVDSTQTIQQVSQNRPNVLFIILESFTAKFVEPLGGEADVTPNLNRLAASGINFTNVYASGDRSEKGMVALLSGYPVQTTTSIIKYPNKTRQLPQLSQVFKENGYSTSYFYGGELEFANIRSYLTNGAYDRLLGKSDFDPATYNSKWGAHDHVLFDRVLQELKGEQSPFFSTVYTLSSHEPFEIPISPKFTGTDTEAQFRNSVYYTDWALGKFLKKAQQENWWENTLVVITADHGHSLPGNDPIYAPSRFHIPFILTGGAVKQSQTIDAVASQTDIAATLLGQLGMPHQQFKWSRNLLSPTSYPFAFYVFNDGFGFATQEGITLFDNKAGKTVAGSNGNDETALQNGKAYMQASFENFVQK